MGAAVKEAVERYKIEALCNSKGPDGKTVAKVWVAYAPSTGVGLDSKDLMVGYLKRIGLAGRVIAKSTGQVVEEWAEPTA